MTNEFVLEAKRRETAQRARNLRYKRPALANLGWDYIGSTLCDIQSACTDVHWFFKDEGENLVAALDGDEEEAYEFAMAFADLESLANMLSEEIENLSYLEDDFQQHFDDCTVALLGNRYNTIGFDTFEEDYYSLCSYESKLATTEAGKRLMRLTKAEMISKIGQCVGITLAFFDLERQYDYLKATMDILRGENNSILQVVKNIEEAYEAAASDRGSLADMEKFDELLRELPERCWVE